MAVLFAALDRLLGRGGALLRAAGRARVAAAALLAYPGYAPHVPRALERAGLRRGLRGLGAARHQGRVRTRRLARFALVGLGVAVLALVRPGNAVLLAFGIVPAPRWPGRGGMRFERHRRIRSSLRSSHCSRGPCTTAFASTRGGSRAAAMRSSPSTARSSPTTSSRPRTARQSRRLAAGDAAAPAHARAISLVRGHARRALRARAASASTRTSTSSPTRSSAGTPTTRVLRDAGVEGVRAHPGTYASRRARTVWDELAKAQFRAASAKRDAALRALEAGDRRDRRQETARAERGRADPGRSGRVDLSSRPEHPAGLDVADRVALRVRPSGRSSRVSSEIEREVDRALRRAPRPRGQRAARAPPQPALTLVPAAVDVDPRRPRRDRVQTTARLADCSSRSRSPRSRSCVLNALGLFADLHFVLPVAPAFVLLGAGGC